MHLIITLKKDIDPESFIKEVINTIRNDGKSSTPEFKTWEIKTLSRKNNEAEKYDVLKQKGTQLEDIGILTFYICAPDKIRVNFGHSTNSKPTEDQEVMYFVRCVAMLRNHFEHSIESISLLGL